MLAVRPSRRVAGLAVLAAGGGWFGAGWDTAAQAVIAALLLASLTTALFVARATAHSARAAN